MKRPKLVWIPGIILIVILIFTAYILYLEDEKVATYDIKIATGTKGGTYYPLGKQFANVLEKLPEINSAQHFETPGSVENIRMILEKEADLAFIFAPTLESISHDRKEEFEVVCNLYLDIIQVVVAKGRGIETLSDLSGKRVYVGKKQSGTKLIAERIFEILEIHPSEKIDEGSFDIASKKLVSGEIDAAFIVSGGTANAVKMALKSGKCLLLDFVDERERISEIVSDLRPVEIRGNFYPAQIEPVNTLGSDALLVCHKDLDEKLILTVTEALFDNVDILLMAHTRAHEIRIENAYENIPGGLDLHPGAIEFRENEKKNLLITTGTFGGKYYDLGRRTKMLLEQYNIPSRFVHTDGSIENTQLLTQRPSIAFIQYDVALAAYWGTPELFYDKYVSEDIDIPEVKSMRRIATLHPETVHIIIRRDQLPDDNSTKKTAELLTGRNICIGPWKSGTGVIAKTILNKQNIIPSSCIFLPVTEMVYGIQNGEIDGGFFVSYLPSQGVKSLLSSEEVALLSIDHKYLSRLISPAFSAAKIEPWTYGCQLVGEQSIETLSTRALLVTTENLPFDVELITEAIFQGASFLGMEKDKLGEDLPSIPLHKDAVKYYQQAGYLPSKPKLDYLERAWRALACLVMIIAGYKGIVHMRREKVARILRKRIFNISIRSSETQSVGLLWDMRRDIRAISEKKWWNLDETRRRELNQLIDDRINEAKSILTKAIMMEILNVDNESRKDKSEVVKRYTSIEEKIWQYYADGELDDSQQDFLMGMVKEKMSLENK